MPQQQTKPKKLTMVQQSIIDARNAPALTAEMQTALDALVSAPRAVFIVGAAPRLPLSRRRAVRPGRNHGCWRPAARWPRGRTARR